MELNAYRITWAILTPAKGRPTKKDLSVINKIDPVKGYTLNGTEIIRHFKTREVAIESVKRITGLSKPYKVVFITDKQFGTGKYWEPQMNVATKRQLIESLIIW